MEKIIIKINQLLFVGSEQRTYDFTPGTHTIYPTDILNEEQWLNEFKVSFMHGWRDNPIHLD
jgi:hypothetical protein